jgi:hypothetical protein
VAHFARYAHRRAVAASNIGIFADSWRWHPRRHLPGHLARVDQGLVEPAQASFGRPLTARAWTLDAHCPHAAIECIQPAEKKADALAERLILQRNIKSLLVDFFALCSNIPILFVDHLFLSKRNETIPVVLNLCYLCLPAHLLFDIASSTATLIDLQILVQTIQLSNNNSPCLHIAAARSHICWDYRRIELLRILLWTCLTAIKKLGYSVWYVYISVFLFLLRILLFINRVVSLLSIWWHSCH